MFFFFLSFQADNGTIIPASNSFADPIDNAKWVGFDKTNDLGYYLRVRITLFITIMTFVL